MLSGKLLALTLLPLLITLPAVANENTTAAPQEEKSTEPIPVLSEKGIPATWLQGTPVKQWEKDKVYVFEFWATWCGPCLAAIPHLDEIHKTLESKKINAQLIGVNVKDSSSPEKLKQFLAKRSVVPSYAIAVDTAGNTNKLWLRPRKVIGIPHAIALKNGNVIWAGHPARLNANFIEQMTSPDFVTGTRPKEAEPADNNEIQILSNKISALYASGQTELAEKKLHHAIEDKRLPDSAKQNLLEIPCYAALDREDYRKMNACLRRKAEAFPKSPENLHDVACFILTTDDIPAGELDLALAEECLNRSLEITGKIPSFVSLHRRQLRLLENVYKRRGDKAAEARMYEASWLASAECDWLNQIEKKLKEDPSLTDAFKVYTELADGKAELPADFVQAPKAAPGKTDFEFEKSSSPESREMLKFLHSLEWVQGNAPKNLPKNGIIAVNFWNPPHPGPQSALSIRPAEWLDGKGIPVVVVAIENKPGRVRKVLGFPRYATDFPVGVIPFEKFSRDFDGKIEIQRLPVTQILRDGKIIWQGSAQDLPRWIVDKATLPDYNHEEAEANRTNKKKVHRNKLLRLREIRQSCYNGDAGSEAQLKAFRETLKTSPTLYMRATNVLAEMAFARNDLAGAGKICEDILQTYPNVDYIAKMQLNILNSNLDLRAANLPVIISAYRNIIGSGDPYASAYWLAISQVYAEMGEWENAVYAAYAARNTTSEWKQYASSKQ